MRLLVLRHRREVITGHEMLKNDVDMMKIVKYLNLKTDWGFPKSF